MLYIVRIASGVFLLLATSRLPADDVHADIANILGVKQANCAQCHPSEVTHWQKTTHFNSLDRLKYAGNTKKYVDAMGIAPETLMSTSLCADCHGTRAIIDDKPQVVSGVSCESCHGGAKHWLKPHGEYFDGQAFSTLAQLRADRTMETEEHRKQRVQVTKEAGMIRPDMLKQLAQNCLNCHLIDNDQLIIAGHKAASAFELTSWINGEVRHNFFMDPETNAAAPSLWLEIHDSTPAARDRLKFVTGGLVRLQTALDRRAHATEAGYIPQIGGVIAAQNGTLAQINAVAQIPQLQSAGTVVTPLFGSLFISSPSDKETFENAADQISELSNSFLQEHDGKNLSALDTLMQAMPPHFSIQFERGQ